MPSHAVVEPEVRKEKLRPEGSARRAILGPTHVQAALGRPCRPCWAAPLHDRSVLRQARIADRDQQLRLVPSRRPRREQHSPRIPSVPRALLRALETELLDQRAPFHVLGRDVVAHLLDRRREPLSRLAITLTAKPSVRWVLPLRWRCPRSALLRGHVLDADGLYDSCCECYAAINAHFLKLIGWSPTDLRSNIFS